VGGQRPNRIGSGELEDPTIDVWFDKAAFVVPASFTYGDSGPGILRSDHQWNVDMSLFKRFEVRTGQTVDSEPRRSTCSTRRTSLRRTPTSIRRRAEE
jgi:hypothetical protein